MTMKCIAAVLAQKMFPDKNYVDAADRIFECAF